MLVLVLVLVDVHVHVRVRVSDLLDSVTTLLWTAALEATLDAETGIWLDEATAALLDDDFHLAARGPRYRLLGPRAPT